MSIESQTEQHVPFRLEAKVIALALEMVCMNDDVRGLFPLNNRALFDLRDKWRTISEASLQEEPAHEGS